MPRPSRPARLVRCLLVPGLLLLASLALAPAARATVTCTFTGSTMGFGTVNPYSGFPYSASGKLAYSCSNSATTSTTVYVCLAVGTGSGGTTAANRTLASGSNTLPIQIFGNSTTTQIGNGTSYPMEGVLSGSIGASASISGNLAMSASMPQPASAPPPGSYSSSFSGTDAQAYYTSGSTAPSSCATLSSGTHSTAQTNFSVSATVATQCTVSATGLAFPTTGVIANAVTATATVSVTCNAATSVTVGLDNGATGTGPTARQMKSSSNSITYGIYRDAAASLPWGNTAGTNTATLSSGTGTLTAYGVVPAQTSPAPGSYSDVVNVVISY